MTAKIVHIVQHLQPGGIETLVLELARVTEKAEVHIVSLQGEAQHALQAWPRLNSFADRITFLNKADGWSVDCLNDLKQYLLQLSPDAVHTHHIGPLIYGGIAARLAKIKRVLHTEHDAWHLKNSKRRWLQALILKWVKPVIIADSGAVSDALQQYFPKQAQQLIFNGIDTNAFSPSDLETARTSLSLPTDKRIVGCAARLEHVKGQDILINALAETHDDIIVAFAGQGSLRAKYESQIASLKLQDRVMFMGNLDNMPTFYNAIDIFCLPSRNEGLPLSLLEAQACNKPVISSRVGGTHEAVCPVTGQLVPAEDPAALSNALQQPQSTDRAPRKFVLEKFSLEKMSDAYFNLAVGQHALAGVQAA